MTEDESLRPAFSLGSVERHIVVRLVTLRFLIYGFSAKEHPLIRLTPVFWQHFIIDAE